MVKILRLAVFASTVLLGLTGCAAQQGETPLNYRSSTPVAPSPEWVDASGNLLPEGDCEAVTWCLANRSLYEALVLRLNDSAALLEGCSGVLSDARNMECLREETVYRMLDGQREVILTYRDVDGLLVASGSGYTVTCADGTRSDAGGKQGACSHHGGVG